MLNYICTQLALWLAAATTLGIAQCRFSADGTGQILTYTFDRTVTTDGTVLHVTLRFHGSPGSQEEIEIPSQWAGETLRGVINIRALSVETVIADAASHGSKVIHHPPDQDVVLAYDVVKDWTGRFSHPAEFHGAL